MIDTSAVPRATTLRLDGDIREHVDAYARRTRRTLNGAVNYLLSVGLEKAAPEGAVAPTSAELHTR